MKWFWMWIGGAITRVAGTGLVIGIFIVGYGAAPGQAVADLLTHLPPWLTNPWFRLALVVIGLALIGTSLHFNLWSLRQKAIDDLAEDLSWAIHHLLNKSVSNESEIAQWESEYKAWCEKGKQKIRKQSVFYTRRSTAF